jgi:hypothetical protein
MFFLGLSRVDTQRIVYGSKACHYWRQKLAAISSGQKFDQPPPERSEGQESHETPIVDDWYLLDENTATITKPDDSTKDH